MEMFQIISEKNKPKFVVLPFGDEEAVQDYMDELWAEKAITDYEKNKQQKLFTLTEVKKQFKQKTAKNKSAKLN